MSKPVPIDPAVESLDQLKHRMEESLRRAAEEHDTRSNRHIPNKAASAGPQFIPYNRNNPPVPPGRPEILCKYYGTVDQIGPAALVAEKAAYIAAMESHGYHFAGSTLVDEPEAIAALRAAGSAGFDTSGWKVTAAEQAHNLFTGVLPGMYYRRLHSSYDRKEERYQSCNRFSVEPGEQITVVYFNVPRPPAPLGQYNHTEFVMHQHTIYGGEVHMPGLRD